MEFSTELPTALPWYWLAMPTIFAAIAWWYAYRCWDFCRDTEQYIKTWRKEPGPGVKKLTQIECELTELRDSLTALHDSLRKLRARIGMRANRAQKGSQGDEIPDSLRDPAGYKAAMRRRLRSGSLK